MNLTKLSIDRTWTLFLDRDGVINKKLPNDYVKKIEEFEFIDGAEEAISKLGSIFGRIVVVTNQQGIGKGLMTVQELNEVHDYMQSRLIQMGGKIDKIYFCPDLADSKSNCRKPNTGMAEEARSEFNEIDFKKSIMVGDSLSDMQMGKRVGMVTVYVNTGNSIKEADYQVESLKALGQSIEQLVKK
ncbi:MAG: HAD family hydrolase [Vicingaceae bacterium]